MKSHIFKSIGWLSAVAAIFCLGLQTPASAQSNCDLTFAPYPGYLTSYITVYPNYNPYGSVQQQLISYFLIDVTNIVNGTNYSNPPIPYGEYPAWCVDEPDYISAGYTIPGTLFSGELYSTCDPNLNSELPPGHPNTLVSPATWDLVNYILNYHMYNGSNAFYWDVQAAINTLVGSDVGSPNPCGGLYTTPTPTGGCEGYPVYDPTVVNALLTAASNNAPSWVPQCGNVLGAIYVTSPTSDQFLIVEVPVPCAPCISVSKQVACLQPTNNCSEFGNIAEGFAGVGCSGINQPAFCFQIVITNCGTIPLTNISVSDSSLGNLTAGFVTNQNEVLEPGASLTNVLSMSFASTTTNMVTVTGDASLSGPVTNGSEVYSNGAPVSDSASAVAQVDQAGVSCSLTLYSPLDLDGNPYDNNVTLPAASYYSTNPLITLSISVTNTGSSALSDVTISSPGLTSFNCSMPAPFNLAVGGSTNIQLCLGYVTCPAQMNFNLNVNADVVPDANHCAVYDLTSTNLISVCSSCSGSIQCSPNYGCSGGTANLTGSVLLNCSTGVTNTNGDTGLEGLTVTLYGGTNNVLGTTTTDVNGNYSFTNLASGIYYVQVTVPGNYVETLPIGVTNGEVEVTIVPCTNANVIFGYANTTPPVITVPSCMNYGCNPTNLPTTNTMASNVSVVVSCGAAMTNITVMESTNACLSTQVFTIIATDTYGNSATNYVTNTWTEATLSFTFYPASTNLGCNPTNIPTVSSISNAVTLADTCSAASYTVTGATTNNGCAWTNIFTIIATNACGNMATAYVTNTWTEATLSFMSIPASTNLGCNPASIPTVSSVSNAVTLADSCSTASYTVTCATTNNGCQWTNVFTISATDACGNTATAYLTNTWTVDTTAPVLIVPAGQSLGCNPTNVPTVSSISNLVKAVDACSTPTINVTCGTTTNDCAVTQIFTVTATDACGNVATTNVTNTWTANTTAPMLIGVPANQNLGCNPTNLATVASIESAVSASGSCGTAVINVTGATNTNGCAMTAIFTITATDSCSNSAVAYVTNTWTADSTPPTLGGVPMGKNLGCNPTNIPTAASVQASVSASDTCSPATIHVTCVTATNACTATQVFTIIATNACGNMATACVTNTWTANPAPPVLSGIPAGKSLGCNPTNIPTAASVQSSVTASDTCSPATVTVTCAITTNDCGATQIFTILATNGCGNMATAYVTNTWSVVPILLLTNTSYATNTTIVTNISYVTNVTVSTNMSLVTNVTVSTNCCTNSICGNFNSQNPGNNSWLWLNAHVNCNPGSNCTVYCQGGSVTLACTDGKSYSFPVPNGVINFSSSCSVATNWFDGTSWHTTLPCAGDSQIFLQGCAIPWQTDFANCQSVCWTAAFSCATPGLNCNWQWGAACYNGSAPGCGSIAPKACQQTACPNGQYYNSGDQAGCPENYKPNCVAGGTGGGAANCTGSWSGTSTTCTFGLKTNVTVTTITTLTTNTTVTTNKTTVPVSTITTNTTVTTTTAGPVLSGVPSGMNFGCNPTNVPTAASVQAGISASETCSAAAVQVTGVNTTNGCAVTQIITITASNACGNSTVAYVTNTWTADTKPPMLSGVPAGGYLGCNSASLPTVSNVLAEVSASDACSAATVTVTNADSTNGCMATRIFTITAADSCGNTVTTNVTYTWTIRTPDYCTNSITCGFNSKNPGSNSWLWLNANCSGYPGSNCTLYCQNSTVTLSCTNGKTYTYPVSNCVINFSASCTNATNWFDGANWNTTLPCAGDSQIFLQGCAIPWQPCFASCQSVSWTGVFSCSAPGQAFTWQFGAACYADSLPVCANICPKAAYNTPCANGQYYSSSDNAGCPENHKPYCVAGGTGLGGANCTGSWSGSDTTCTFAPGTVLPPVLSGIPACDNFGINPTNIPTCASILAEVTGSDTCSPPVIGCTMTETTNGCLVTQIFTITATNVCGAGVTNYVTNTWTTMACTNRCTNTICSSFNSQNPGSNCWVWFNAQLTGKPGNQQVYVICSNASVTLNCQSGKSYTFPVPNGQILFSPACTNGTNWFDGTNWNTTLPCGGDDQIFVQGCAIPWQSDFANCQSVCWSGVYCCNVPGLSFNWQFGAACYSGQQPSYPNLCPKACHQTPCQNGQYYNSSHNAGTPENWNPYCVGGGTGFGGSNCTGNFSNPGTCSF